MIYIFKYHGRQLIFIVLSIFLTTSYAVADEEYGRYRATVLNEGGQTGQAGKLTPKVFIIDSKEGHMWILEQNARLHGPKGDFSLGTVLTYQGRVRPGKKMGDIVDQAVLQR